MKRATTNTYSFEKPKLKNLVQVFLRTGGNWEEGFPASYKKPMRLFIYENIPQIDVCDGFHYMEAVFTKECMNDFRKNYSHLKFSDLRAKNLFVQKWSLNMRHRDSKKCNNSFQNLAVYIQIEQFKAITHERPS